MVTAAPIMTATMVPLATTMTPIATMITAMAMVIAASAIPIKADAGRGIIIGLVIGARRIMPGTKRVAPVPVTDIGPAIAVPVTTPLVALG